MPRKRVKRFFCRWIAFCLPFLLMPGAVNPCLASGNREISAPVRKVPVDRKLIALTFDDGPNARYTEEILDLLAEYGIKATFFVIGENAESNPDLIRREIREGHEIGSHTYSHPTRPEKLTDGQLKEELEKTEAVLTEITGIRPILFRPPGGNLSEGEMRLLEEHSYRTILWSVDPRDWAVPPVSQIAENVLENTEPGAILLFHDGISPKSNTPAALRQILPKLLAQGYEFVTVSKLLEAQRVTSE